MRILVLGGGMGTVLGQTMRALAIARRLSRLGEEVLFGYVGRPIEAVDAAGVPLVYLPEPAGGPPAFPWQQIATGGSISPEALAAGERWRQGVAAEQTELARQFRPDVILSGSFSGPSVARAVGVPSAFVVLQPHGAGTLRMFAGRAQVLKQWIDSVEALIVEGMPELAPLEGDVPWGRPEATHYVGPLLLRAPEELPSPAELREKFGAGPGPLVWVTVGGGSDLLGVDFLTRTVDAFRLLPDVQVLLSTGFHVSEGFGALPPNVHAQRFFPGEEAAWASDAVVFHGGSSTLMHLIGLGRPGIALPSIDEQRDNAAVLVRFGAGLTLDPRQFTAETLAAAVQQALAEPSFREGAAHLRDLARCYGGTSRAAEIVRALGSRS